MMKIRRNIFIISLFIFAYLPVYSQIDFAGKWSMDYKTVSGSQLTIEIDIYAPTGNLIYPSHLKITYNEFVGEYDFLLVKRDELKLAIARNKYPINETPFSLNSWLFYLNGNLEFDTKTKLLKLNRIRIEHAGIFMNGLYEGDEIYTHQKAFIRDFLYNEPFQLTKIKNFQSVHPRNNTIVNPSDIYYGMYEPIKVSKPIITISVLDEERFDKDSITILHNEKLIANQYIGENPLFLENIKLDEGNNYFAFFAESYGTLPPNTANFLLYTEDSQQAQYSFDFTHRANAYATFMLANIIYTPPSQPKLIATPTPQKDSDVKNLLIHKLTTSSNKIRLKIWDNQKEDGDIISIYLNEIPIVNHMELKNKPIYLGIELKKGRNLIIFKAENIGKIPPNTGMLSIENFKNSNNLILNTDKTRNNYIEIIYTP